MNTVHTNPLSILHALIFMLRVGLMWALRLCMRFGKHLFVEVFWLLRHNTLADSVQRLYRVMRIAGRKRMGIFSLKWRYRPRVGDLFSLVFLVILVGQLALTETVRIYSRDFLTFSSETSSGDGDAAPAGDLSALSVTRQVHVVLESHQSLGDIWRQLGVQIKDGQQLSQAFSAFYDRRYPELRRTLPIRLDLARVTDATVRPEAEVWGLQNVMISLTEDYALLLTPTVTVFGETLFTSRLQDKPTPQTQILVRDSVARLVHSEHTYALDVQGGQMSDSGIPLYIEDLVLYLDRLLEQQGGLKYQDFVTAIYSTQPGEGLRLEYAKVLRNENSLEMVRFSTDMQDEGHMYEINGRAIVPSSWGEPLTNILRISSEFGLRLHPTKGYSDFHRGIDYTAPIGTPVYATQAGLVLNMQNEPEGYGKWVRIKHEGEFSTLYAHLLDFHPDLKPGYPVKKSQIIGFLGNTGRSTGPHLHYEVHFQDHAINPKLVQMPESRLLKAKLNEQLVRMMQKRRAQVQRLIAAQQ